MKCPKCGNDNKNSNIRCEFCGEQLISNEEINLFNENEFQKNNNPLNDARMEVGISFIGGIFAIIFGLIFCVFCLNMFFKGGGIDLIPFGICGIAILIYGISALAHSLNTKKAVNDVMNGEIVTQEEYKEQEKKAQGLSNIAYYIYIFGFLIFWFGFLIVFDYHAIKSWSNGGSRLFLFSLIFWLVGICVLVNNLKKNK